MYVVTQLELIRQTALNMRDTTSENDERHKSMTAIVAICDDLIGLQ